jgi:hypothetical protein
MLAALLILASQPGLLNCILLRLLCQLLTSAPLVLQKEDLLASERMILSKAGPHKSLVHALMPLVGFYLSTKYWVNDRCGSLAGGVLMPCNQQLCISKKMLTQFSMI